MIMKTKYCLYLISVCYFIVYTPYYAVLTRKCGKINSDWINNMS